MPKDPTPKPVQKTDFARLALLGVIALAFLLRLYGIGWALPNASRYFSYHTDESIVLGASLRLDPLHFQFDPHFYNYGSLSLLLNAWAIQLGHLSGLVTASPLSSNIASASELLCARLVTVALGALTCGFLYGAGRVLYGRLAGLVAALLYAIAPIAVQHGHWATVDVPATFWISGTLYFAARTLSPEKRRFDFVACGLFVGLAAATKYNAGLVLLPCLAAWAMQKPKREIADLLALIGATIVGFVWGCPAIVLNPVALLRDGVLFEANHVAHGADGAFQNTPSGFVFHLWNLEVGLTLPILLLALLGTVWALRQRKPGDLLLLAFASPYYLLIGAAQIKFARYTLPLFPPLFLLVGRLVSRVDFTETRVWRRAVALPVALCAMYALLFAVALDQVMALPDTRDRAADYLKQNALAPVGFATRPWFYTPPTDPLFAAPVPKAGEFWDSATLTGNPPAAIPLSEFEYRDPLRTRDVNAEAYLVKLQATYPHVTTFEQPIEVFGFRFVNIDLSHHGLPTQSLPYDMLYTNPTTMVYTR